MPREELHLAGPAARGRPRADQRRRRRRAQGEDPRRPASASPSWSRPPGPRPRPSAAATSAAAPTVPASAWSRRRTGRSTTRPSWPRCWRHSRASRAVRRRRPTKQVSLADLIVLAGGVGVEQAAAAAGTTSRFRSRRVAPTPARSRPTSSPSATSSRRRRLPQLLGKKAQLPAEYLLLDRANLLTLSAPEMTVLVAGLRVLEHQLGRLDARRAHRAPGPADPTTSSSTCSSSHRPGPPTRARLRGHRRATGVDLDRQPRRPVFGSNSELRALAEVYAATTRRRSSSTTSSPPGSRSWSWTASTCTADARALRSPTRARFRSGSGPVASVQPVSGLHRGGRSPWPPVRQFPSTAAI